MVAPERCPLCGKRVPKMGPEAMRDRLERHLRKRHPPAAVQVCMRHHKFDGTPEDHDCGFTEAER